MNWSIEASGLKKVYGKTEAVNDISLNVGKGEIFGLIGPDGAGKTSVFRMLTTLVLPDEGNAKVCGLDIVKDFVEIRKRIGYMPGRFSLYQDLSVEENLNFFATMFGTTVAQNYETVKEIYSQIEPFKNRRAGKLSGGMKQKLALCCSLIHKPEVLFLDEPTTGVDAVSRKDFWTMLQRIKESGVTIFVSTPYMDEAGLCDRIALIKQGKIIQRGTPQEISLSYPYHLIAIKGTRIPALLKFIRNTGGVISCFSFGDSLHAAIDNRSTSSETIIQAAKEAGFEDCSATCIQAGIEDCFMQLSET